MKNIQSQLGRFTGRKPRNLSRKQYKNIWFQKQCGDIKPESHVRNRGMAVKNVRTIPIKAN